MQPTSVVQFQSNCLIDSLYLSSLPEVKLAVTLEALVEAQQQRDEDAGNDDVAETKHCEIARIKPVHE